MRIDSVSGLPSEVERPATTGAVTAAATEIGLHSNDSEAPVTASTEVRKDLQEAPEGRGETVWLENEKRQVYRVIDEKSGTILCQVPSDEVLRVARNLDELSKEETTSHLDIES